VPVPGRPDQRVERYSYAGAQVGTAGQSYLSGPTPGLIGPPRFAGPRAVDVDSQGNVYIMQSGIPGRGTNGWLDDEAGYYMVLSKITPGGAEVWNAEGSMFGTVGEPSPRATPLRGHHDPRQGGGRPLEAAGGERRTVLRAV
jgi:hypothetical protein